MRTAAILLTLAASAAVAGCSSSHRSPDSGLDRAARTDLASRLVLPQVTGVTVRLTRPIVTASSPAAFLSHSRLTPAIWEYPPDPKSESAALQREGFVSAAGEALVDPAVNVHSDVIRFRSAIEANAALRRIDAANLRRCRAQQRCAQVARFDVSAIPDSKATVRSGDIPGIGHGRSYRVLFTDGQFLYGEQIESVPSPEVRGKFVAASTRLYVSVRGRLGPP